MCQALFQAVGFGKKQNKTAALLEQMCNVCVHARISTGVEGGEDVWKQVDWWWLYPNKWTNNVCQ